jgi:3-deoxy-manno-octulosonate cytidylyltransferase (CMP-KDO synthetase)
MRPLSSVQNTQSNTIKPSLYIVVPARLASTRLPEKALALISNRPMITWVLERAIQFADQMRSSMNFEKVLVILATDSQRIASAVGDLAITSVMTSSDLASGTDRTEAALAYLSEHQQPKPSDLVLNIQGDEPFFSLEDIGKLALEMLSKSEAPMGTLAYLNQNHDMFFQTSVVKVVCDSENNALYFSRSPIPWPRVSHGATGSLLERASLQSDRFSGGFGFLQHVGVYAFRYAHLVKFAKVLPKGGLEESEGLEQLRALSAGWKIHVVRAKELPSGIDTPEDLARANKRS